MPDKINLWTVHCAGEKINVCRWCYDIAEHSQEEPDQINVKTLQVVIMRWLNTVRKQLIR